MTDTVTRRRFLAGVGGAVGASTTVGTGAATPPAPGAEVSETPGQPPTAAELAAFFDERLPTQLEEHGIAGATVSVVVDGEMRFASGYGVADAAADRPVRADETRFRIGSVSKSITGTAMMRGIEAGVVDLETDVREYVDDLRLPGPAGPVTLEHLGTHTAGFEASGAGVFARSREDMADLGTTVRSDPPARVRPPGELASYSNYGVALAGYALSSAAGRSFADYVHTEVFEPLGMSRSTVAQPPEDSVAAGHVMTADGLDTRGFEFVPERPAGAVSATATDMGRFMLAHLRGGRVNGEQYLAEETVTSMHAARFRNHPAVNGVGYGFYELSRGDTRIVGHHGDTRLFHSLLALFPERDMGLFVSYNTAGASQAREALFDAFISRFTPPGDPDPPQPEGRPAKADAITGWYRGTRVARTEPDRLLGAPGSVQVSVAADGTLVTDPVIGADRQRWVEVEPLVFQAVDGHERLAFREQDGEISYMLQGPLGVAGFRPLGPHEHPLGQAATLAVSLLVMLTALLGWAAGGVYRRVTDGSSMGRRPRAARYLAGGSALLLLAAPAGLVAAVAQQPVVLYGLPAWTTAAFLLSSLGALGAVAAAVVAGVTWRESFWGPMRRLHYTAVAAAAVLFAWLLWYWNLLWPW